jgi:hypothetical protein
MSPRRGARQGGSGSFEPTRRSSPAAAGRAEPSRLHGDGGWRTPARRRPDLLRRRLGSRCPRTACGCGAGPALWSETYRSLGGAGTHPVLLLPQRFRKKKGQVEREKVASELNHLAIKPCLEQRIENKGIEKNVGIEKT